MNARNEPDDEIVDASSQRDLVLALFFAVFTTVTSLALLVPFKPNMPELGLDPSWRMAMSVALAQSMKIGREIVFTFGPYSQIYTGYYHPKTDTLVMMTSVALAASYSVCLWRTGWNSRIAPTVVLLLFCTTVSRDTVLQLYPLVLIAHALTANPTTVQPHQRVWSDIGQAVVLVPIGLLPLVKGSVVFSCSIVPLLVAVYHFRRDDWRSAAMTFCVPPLATVVFWLAAGQPVATLPEYFLNIAAVASGYSEGAALWGKPEEIYTFLAAAAVVLFGAATTRSTTVDARLLLIAGLAIFFFTTFKAGFVRHDGHAIIAGESLVVAAIVVGYIHLSARTLLALAVSVVAWSYIGNCCQDVSFPRFVQRVRDTYAQALDGLSLRRAGSARLISSYDRSLDKIRTTLPLPTLPGTTDIYSYDQAQLLASHNRWNPRPVFQSYLATTGRLALINERHLRAPSAPDNLLFRLQPSDGNLPSLEDGVSWPAIFDNYALDTIKGDLAYFRKKDRLIESSTFGTAVQSTRQLGAAVALSERSRPMFAEIEIKPTMVGALAAVLFKPPQLTIDLVLLSGSRERYNLRSNETTSGFFISPLVHDVYEFGVLATGNARTDISYFVKEFTIGTSRLGSWFWQGTYTLKMKPYQGEIVPLPGYLVDTTIGGIPGGYPEPALIDCRIQGAALDMVNGVRVPLDMVNGVVAAGHELVSMSRLSVLGWLAASASDGILADKTFVVLTDALGNRRFWRTRTMPRPDVADAFHRPALVVAGFSATIDVAALRGKYVLSLAREYGGGVQQCKDIEVPITIGEGQ